MENYLLLYCSHAINITYAIAKSDEFYGREAQRNKRGEVVSAVAYHVETLTAAQIYNNLKRTKQITLTDQPPPRKMA